MPSFLNRNLVLICIVLFTLLLSGCAADQPAAGTPAASTQPAIPTGTPEQDMPEEVFKADVLSVQVSGDPGSYRFSVEIFSPDEGCQQYADWWEVLSPDGELLYRRILTHSHVDEQPFVRSGGPLDIQEDTLVIIRAHMYPSGYGGTAMHGSPQAGFETVDLPAVFAAQLEGAPPQPQGCAF